ncbi:MAG: nuclear transport factor 2 family protein, partial [Bacteroidota bacterium]
MKTLELEQRDIAVAFSNGDFEQIYPYLSETITWNIIGEEVFQGKSKVVENCKRTAEYFGSVETDFRTEDTIVTNNKVVVRGTGEFKRDGIRVNLITACDVYEFNQKNELENISSSARRGRPG